MIDKKKLFMQLVELKTPVVVKFKDGTVQAFRARSVSQQGHLFGRGVGKGSEFKARQAVILFYAGRDRYFLNTSVINSDGQWCIQNCADFYKLNRRETHRIEVPEGISLALIVNSINKVNCQVQARMTDFSIGGARIRWTSALGLANGYEIVGKLLWLRGKEIPIHAVVRHKTKDGLFGIEFIDVDPALNNKLRFLSIELQQMVNY